MGVLIRAAWGMMEPPRLGYSQVGSNGGIGCAPGTMM
jgi:hypothetical protein